METTEKILRKGDTAECKLCGKEFTLNHGSQIYCSSRCRTEAFHQKPRDWGEEITIQNATTEQIERALYWAQIKKAKKLPTRDCQHCHKTFQPTRNWQVYCCEKHRELGRQHNIALELQKTEDELYKLETENKTLRGLLDLLEVPYKHLLTDTSQIP